MTFTATVLFFEWAVEAAFPCPAGIVGGFATWICNVAGLVFLCLFLIPNIGKNDHYCIFFTKFSST